MTPRKRADPVLLTIVIALLTPGVIVGAFLGIWLLVAVAILVIVRCALDVQPVTRFWPSRALSQFQETVISVSVIAFLILLQFIATGDRTYLLFLITSAGYLLWTIGRALISGRSGTPPS